MQILGNNIHLATKFLMWNWNSPLQIPGNAMLFESFLEPSIRCLNGIPAPQPDEKRSAKKRRNARLA